MTSGQEVIHSENISTVITVQKPQQNNHALELEILKLNFAEPLKISNHLFYEETKLWCPRTNLCQVKLNKQYTTRLDITEVKNAKQMKNMTEHLSQMPEWTVDVEHHTEYSYAGIICLIQISTTEKNFLIDPFHLNKEIKRDLKPLMESGNYVKVMHESYNELRWLQRDFNIFVWPVVDTQVIYRKIKTIQNVEHFHSNITLVCLILNYFPFVEIPKDQSQADFRIRPLTDELQYFAVLGSAFLLPILCALRSDLEANPCGIEFDTLVKNCVEYMARKFLYKGKIHTSAEEDIERFRIKNSVEISTFLALYHWRNDKSKVLDENPNQILPVANLVAVSRIKKPSNVDSIQKLIPKGAQFISKLDIIKMKEIIDSGNYDCMNIENATTPCSTCGEYSHPVSFWPGRKQRCDSQGRLFFKNWQNHIADLLNKESHHLSQDMVATQPVTNLSNVINRFSYSKSNQLGLYAFTLTELNWLAVEIKTCIIHLKKLLKCPFCSITIEKAVLENCGCGSKQITCKSCWSSCCTVCQTVNDANPIAVNSIDVILDQNELFLEAVQENDSESLFFAIVDFLTKSEMELMCSYCFMHLENTLIVPKEGDYGQLIQCCRSCYQFYIQQNTEKVEPLPLELFDKICEKFTPLYTKFLLYCQQNKSKHYKDSFEVFGRPSSFREKAQENVAVSSNQSTFGMKNLILNDSRGKEETVPILPFSQQVGDLSAQLVECNQ